MGRSNLLLQLEKNPVLSVQKALDRSLITAQYGYALDSDGKVGDIIVAAPTQAKIKTIIRGKKTAHAGVAPEKGVSAITIAAKAIAKKCR
ncbi:hypothetical protein GCM10020331_041700 [Ectobacillus funiculus]